MMVLQRRIKNIGNTVLTPYSLCDLDFEARVATDHSNKSLNNLILAFRDEGFIAGDHTNICAISAGSG